jgi:2-(1,2-epoxy-1,2-dihydrophenyl)acetyl-CoA isomerase
VIQSLGPLRLVHYDQGSVEVVFTEAQRGNPIDAAFCDAIHEVSVQLGAMPRLRSVLFRAEGHSFSVGGDLKLLAADLDATPALVLRMVEVLNAAIVRLQNLDAPLIAAIQGPCAGGMVGFAAGCDIVIAADTARFVSAYTTIGYSCDAGVSTMLTRRMGIARTRRYLLLNEHLDAMSAQSAGLVDFVVCVGDLVPRSKAIAARIASGPTRAFGEMRRLLSSAGSQTLVMQLESEAVALSRVTATADAREGVTAFLHRRAPNFHGV